MGRNSAIDMAKLMAAILVIGIHTHPLQDVSKQADFLLVEVFCRQAVPFFAICTGYYLCQAYLTTKQLKPVLSACKKVLKLYLGWSSFYFLIHLYDWYTTGTLCSDYVTGWFKSLIVSSSYFHLWYLSGLLYALPFFAVIVKWLPHRWLWPLIALLWCIQCFDYGYSSWSPHWLSRFNGLFGQMDALHTGLLRMLPLLLTGALMTKWSHFNMKTRTSLGVWLVMMVLLTAEALLLRHLGGTRYSYIFLTLPTTACLFAALLTLGSYVKVDTRRLAKISLTVYCIHPAFIWLLKDCIHHSFVMFTFVAVLSIGFSYAQYIMKTRFLKM